MEQFFAVRRFSSVLEFTADGTHLLFASNISGQFNLWRVPIEGGWPDQLTAFADETVRGVGVSPTDGQIVFCADHDGDEFHQLYLLDSDRGWPEKLTDEPKVQHNVGSALGLPEGFGINGAVWTLSIEALFYAILPLVAVGFFRRPVIGLGLGLGIAAAWRLAVAHSTLHVASLPGVATPAATRVILITQFPSFAGHFALGMMAAWLFVKMRRSRFAGSPWTVVLQVLGLSGIILSMELLGHRDLAKTAGPLDHWTTTTPLALSFAVLLLSTALAPRWAQWPVANPVARHLGDISYGIYLSHLLFVELALTSLHFFPAGNLVAFLRMVGFVATGSLLVGWASFVWVERPLMRWARRRSRRREDHVPTPILR